MINIAGDPLLGVVALALLISGLAVGFILILYPQIAQKTDFTLGFLLLLSGFVLLGFNFRMQIIIQKAFLSLSLITIWYTYESIQLRRKSRKERTED
jgi:Ycf66 protein N-terminus